MSDFKNPAATENVLRTLSLICDALSREAYIEAIKYLGDALAEVQNELDWCYRTDLTLPFMREYLLALTDSLGSIQYLIPQYRASQGKLVIQNIKETINQISQNLNKATHTEPDRYIDALEREHRIRTYGQSG